MPQVEDPVRLRRLLEGAYDRIGVLEEELEQVRAANVRGAHAYEDSKTRQGLLEADLQMSKTRGDRLASAARDIVNHPTSQRADVQGKLLVALEIWDGRRP